MPGRLRGEAVVSARGHLPEFAFKQYAQLVAGNPWQLSQWPLASEPARQFQADQVAAPRRSWAVVSDPALKNRSASASEVESSACSAAAASARRIAASDCASRASSSNTWTSAASGFSRSLT